VSEQGGRQPVAAIPRVNLLGAEIRRSIKIGFFMLEKKWPVFELDQKIKYIRETEWGKDLMYCCGPSYGVRPIQNQRHLKT